MVGRRAVANGLDQYLHVAELLLGQDVAKGPEGAQVGLASAHGGDQAGVVGGDYALDLDAQGLGKHVHEGLDVVG